MACIAVLLVGIVFLNVRLLELDGGIARDAERAAALKRETSSLRMRAARLGSSERVQRVATERGFVWPAPGRVRYLHPDARPDARLAATRMTEPAAASAPGTAPEPAPPGAASSPAATTSVPATTTSTATTAPAVDE